MYDLLCAVETVLVNFTQSKIATSARYFTKSFPSPLEHLKCSPEAQTFFISGQLPLNCAICGLTLKRCLIGQELIEDTFVDFGSWLMILHLLNYVGRSSLQETD